MLMHMLTCPARDENVHAVQSVYNEEMFFLSHGSYSSAQVTVRAMDIMVFMNSKVELTA